MIRISGPSSATNDDTHEPSSDDLSTQLIAHRTWLDSGGGSGQRANLSGMDLSHQDLAGVVLSKARMVETNLTGADLSDAVLDQVNLYGADLTDAELPRATLIEASLCEVQLDGADLTGADLSRADLSDAQFGSACLQDANLSRTELEGADLRRAELSGCDLTGADIAGAQCVASSMDDVFEAYDVDDVPVDEEPISEMPDADLDEHTEASAMDPAPEHPHTPERASAAAVPTLLKPAPVAPTTMVSCPAPTATPASSPAAVTTSDDLAPTVTVSSAATDSAPPAPAVTLAPAPAPVASPAAITAPLQIAANPALAGPRVDLLAERMAQDLAREFAQNLIGESIGDESETEPQLATTAPTNTPQPPNITSGPAPAPLVTTAGSETNELAEALQQHHRWQRSRGREGQQLDLSWTGQQAFSPEQRQQLAGADLSGALAPPVWPGLSAISDALRQVERQLMWLLGGCVYLILALASMMVADGQQPVMLPILGVPVSAHWFGLLAPLTLMLLHGGLHLSLVHLGQVARSLPQVLPDGSRPEQLRASLGLMALPQDQTTAKRWSNRLGRGLSTMLLWLMTPAILVLMCSLWWATMGTELLVWAGICTITTLLIGIASRRALNARRHGLQR